MYEIGRDMVFVCLFLLRASIRPIPDGVAVTLGPPMNKRTARTIADGLTWARIWSAVPITLLAWLDFKWWVLGLYIAAALTDLLDGMFARRAAPPQTNTDFDGLADMLLSVMTLVWLWMLIPGFFSQYWLPYLPVLLLIEVFLITMRVVHSGIVVPHFQFGRYVMALFFFLLPVLIIFGDQPMFVHVALILGVASKLQLAWHFATCAKPDRSSEPA